MVTREEFYVDSVDGIHMIHGFRWYNTDKAYKGVIQVVHGMLEYIERYDEFAKAMAENGYFVIGHDHLGHGDSVIDSEELGYVGEQGAFSPHLLLFSGWNWQANTLSFSTEA